MDKKLLIKTILECFAMIGIVSAAVCYLHFNPITITKTVNIFALNTHLRPCYVNIVPVIIVTIIPIVGFIDAMVQVIRDIIIEKL